MATFRWTDESIVEIHAKSSVHPIHSEVHAVTGGVSVGVDGSRLVLQPAPSGHVELAIDALRSGNKLEDFEMRRRLDAKKFPIIRYELSSTEGDGDHFKLSGKLTFHGVTQEVLEDVEVHLEGDKLRVTGEHTFDIRDFDVKPPKILNLQVHPEVRVVARLVGRRES